MYSPRSDRCEGTIGLSVVYEVHLLCCSLRFINVKIIMPTRSVDILRAVPQLTGTNALAIFGGYLGIWLGLSLHAILRMMVFNVFKKIVRIANGVYLKLASVSEKLA